MPDLLYVLLIAMLPAGGNVVGSLLAESVQTPSWLIGAALHATAGIGIAVVSVDLMPRLIGGTLPPFGLALTVLAGAASSVLLARGVEGLRARFASGREASSSGSAGAWMVYASVAVDLVSDGQMTGAGSAVPRSLGLMLALSQSVANVPGGFATGANFRDEGVRTCLPRPWHTKFLECNAD